VQGDENSAGIFAAEYSSRPIADRQINLLCRLWTEALEVSSVGLDDDFFSLGGDSLTVARIVVTAAAEGVTIDPSLFVQYRTIREMANEVELSD
jgi:hypothetical protein